MAIPQLTPEERQAALDKAKQARMRRSQIREDLKSGVLTVPEVIAMRDDEVIGRMKVSTLIETIPGYGAAKSQKLMADLRIAPSRRLRGLGQRQVDALLEYLA